MSWPDGRADDIFRCRKPVPPPQGPVHHELPDLTRRDEVRTPRARIVVPHGWTVLYDVPRLVAATRAWDRGDIETAFAIWTELREDPVEPRFEP